MVRPDDHARAAPAAAQSSPAGAQSSPAAAQSSPPGAREALAAAQARLLAALVAAGEPPAGFDEARLRIQASSLISKRRATVARLRPDLVALLGGDFAREFEAYARGRPKPPGGSRADARDFADRLEAAGRIGREPEPETITGSHRWPRLRDRARKLFPSAGPPGG